ncbi:MAG: hypothetical protein EBZ83_04930, partial [Verrucomicrobia bacterium]|nr:hypothetical protein [Verrucomicrobiota bacterium]
GSEASNYILSSAAGISIDITPKPLTVASGLTATNKVYDGTRQAVISGTPVLGGVVGGDVVDIDPASVATALFANANAGTNKVVEVTGYTLTGAQAGNYTLTLPVNLAADIGPKPLTLSGVTASSKVYNKSDAATLGGSASLSGVVGSDIVNLDTSAANARFADANVGTNKAVAVTGLSLGGAAAGNYSLGSTSTLAADITPKPITVTADAKSKIYGDSDPTLTQQVTTGSLESGDSFTGSLTRATGETIGTYAIGQGTLSAGANYTITFVSKDLTITKKNLTVSGALAQNKSYDGNTTATISGAALVGVVGADDVTLANDTAGTFAQRTPGSAIGVSTAMTLSGADAGNYSVIQPTGLTANITGKPLTITGAVATNRVYDGSTIIGVSGGTLVGIATNDTVTLIDANASGTVASKVVGTNKAVTVTGYLLGGADAVNYTLTHPTNLTVNITKKALTVTGAVAQDKNYNGNTVASIAGATLVGVVAGDLVNLSGGGNFATATVGTNKAVTANFSLTGTDAGNYTLTQPAGLTASITVGPLQAVNDTLTIPSNYAAYTSQSVSLPSILWNDGQGLGSPAFAIKSSANGYTVTRRGNVLTVSRPAGLVTGEAFRYTLSEDTDMNGTIDPAAGEVTEGIVTFAAGTTTAGTLKIVDTRVDGSGNFVLIFSAMPGTKWQLQKTASLSSPLWVDVGSSVT